MQDGAEKAVWRKCEELGIAGARARVQTVTGIMERQHILAWLEMVEYRDRVAAEKRNFEIAERNAKAAEISAQATVESAKAAGQSARAAIFAALVSLFALAVAIAAYLKQ